MKDLRYLKDFDVSTYTFFQKRGTCSDLFWSKKSDNLLDVTRTEREQRIEHRLKISLAPAPFLPATSKERDLINASTAGIYPPPHRGCVIHIKPDVVV